MPIEVQVSAFAKINEEVQCHTQSREGAWFKGVRNEIRSHVLMSPRRTETTEWALIPSHTPQRTVQYGDSGAWCFTSIAEDMQDVRAIGMIFGGPEDASVSYVTPMEVIVEDIREQTGMCVRLPQCPELP